ncbi:unnamed protein product [Arabidopsis halleri]
MGRASIKQNRASYHSRIHSSLNFLFSYFSTMDSSPVAPVHGQDDYPNLKPIWTSNIKGTKDKQDKS